MKVLQVIINDLYIYKTRLLKQPIIEKASVLGRESRNAFQTGDILVEIGDLKEYRALVIQSTLTGGERGVESCTPGRRKNMCKDS